jgi:tetratricopeptide (TPR) repeat protein
VEADVTERGPLPDLFAIFERVARRIAPGSSTSAQGLDGLHPPLAVFEDFVKGLLAETPATAIGYLNSALRREPAFDRARLALWDVFTEQGDHPRARAAAVLVPAASPLFRRARFLVALSDLSLKKFEEAFVGFKALADQAPTPALMNNLGVAQLNRAVTPQTGQPTYYFNKAVEQDPDDADYLFNLGYAYWQDHDPQAAIYWLRGAVRHTPSDADAHFVLAAALAAGGSAAEAARERELARRLSAAYEPRDRRTAVEVVPKGLERTKTEVELPHERPVALRLAATEQHDQAELAQFYLERARRQYQQENDREAAAELNRALYLSPYLAEAHLLLGRVHLRNGRAREAIDVCKIALWSDESAEAHAVLGEAYRQAKDLDAARAEAERALALDPTSAEARTLMSALAAR